MNFHKALYKVTLVLAILMVLVLIGLMVYRSHLIKRANREAAMEKETAAETMGPENRNETGKDVGPDGPALKPQQIENKMKMLEDPSVIKSIRSGLETQYQSLFEMLPLSPEQREKFEEILSNSAMSYLELNPEILDAVTDEEKILLQQRYDRLREETRLRIEAVLGYDGFQKYMSYEKRSFSRKVVTGFAESLPSGDDVTDEQKGELIDIIFEESEKVYADIGYDPTIRLDFPSDMDTETVLKKMEITERILFNAEDRSRDILTESQLNAYHDYLRIFLEREEMSLITMREQYFE